MEIFSDLTVSKDVFWEGKKRMKKQWDKSDLESFVIFNFNISSIVWEEMIYDGKMKQNHFRSTSNTSHSSKIK